MDNDPYVWGGQVEEAQSSMGSYELEQGGPVDFGYELPVAGAGEEVAVYLGELRQATEEPARPTARWAAECGVPSQAGSEATTSVELTALAHITTIEELRAEYRKAMAERQGRASEAELRRAVLDADIAYTERLYFREPDKRLRPLGIGVPAQLLKLQPYIRPRAAGLDVIKHDARRPGLTRPCGSVIEIR